MSRVMQLCLMLCCLVKLTLASLSCTDNNPISICNDDRQQGGNVNVNFARVPLFENNVSCSCFIFAQSDTEITTAYKTFLALDTIDVLVRSSIRLGDQTFKEATKGFINVYGNSSKKLHFNGDIGEKPPEVCLTFSSRSSINIEVVCLPSNNTTVPISGFATTTKTTKGIISETTTQPTSSATEQSTPSFAELSSSNTAEAAIGGAVGGGFLVVAIVMVVVVIMCRRRRLSVRQNKEQNINMSFNQTEENPYNVENELYVSADDDILASGNQTYDVTHLQGFDVNHDKAKTIHDVTNNLSDSDNTYEQPDQYNPKMLRK